MSTTSKARRNIAGSVGLAAILAAAVAVVTMFLRVPIPRTGGYLNFGDIVVVFSGVYFGPLVGFIAGGVGSAFADLVGFPVFAPFTLVIKGFEGMLAGVNIPKSGRLTWIGPTLGAVVMVAGYFFVEVMMEGIGWGGAIIELPFNVFQGVVGVVGGLALARVLGTDSEKESGR